MAVRPDQPIKIIFECIILEIKWMQKIISCNKAYLEFIDTKSQNKKSFGKFKAFVKKHDASRYQYQYQYCQNR